MQINSKFFPELSGVGARLRHERARLGWNQNVMAEKGGVSRMTLGRYERNESFPDLNFLAAVAGEGVDFVYVCCGVLVGTTAAGDVVVIR